MVSGQIVGDKSWQHRLFGQQNMDKRRRVWGAGGRRGVRIGADAGTNALAKNEMA